MDIHFVLKEGDYLSSPSEGKLHPGGLNALRPCWEGALHLSPTHVDKEGVVNLGQDYQQSLSLSTHLPLSGPERKHDLIDY